MNPAEVFAIAKLHYFISNLVYKNCILLKTDVFDVRQNTYDFMEVTNLQIGTFVLI